MKIKHCKVCNQMTQHNERGCLKCQINRDEGNNKMEDKVKILSIKRIEKCKKCGRSMMSGEIDINKSKVAIWFCKICNHAIYQ